MLDDSFIMAEEEAFGQVVDILWLPDRLVGVLLLRHFEKIDIPSGETGDGPNILFPMNQFPVRATNRHSAFVVAVDSYFQKILYSELTLKRDRNSLVRPTIIFAVRPNPWFRF